MRMHIKNATLSLLALSHIFCVKLAPLKIRYERNWKHGIFVFYSHMRKLHVCNVSAPLTKCSCSFIIQSSVALFCLCRPPDTMEICISWLHVQFNNAAARIHIRHAIWSIIYWANLNWQKFMNNHARVARMLPNIWLRSWSALNLYLLRFGALHERNIGKLFCYTKSRSCTSNFRTPFGHFAVSCMWWCSFFSSDWVSMSVGNSIRFVQLNAHRARGTWTSHYQWRTWVSGKAKV